MLIYNFVPPVDGPTWNEYIYALLDINKMYPLRSAIYLPLMTFFKHEIPYRFCVWFGHFLPALFLDAASICIGRSPRYKVKAIAHKSSNRNYKTVKSNKLIGYCIGAKHCCVSCAKATRVKCYNHGGRDNMMQLDSVSLNPSLSMDVLIDKFQGHFFQMRSHV